MEISLTRLIELLNIYNKLQKSREIGEVMIGDLLLGLWCGRGQRRKASLDQARGGPYRVGGRQIRSEARQLICSGVADLKLMLCHLLKAGRLFLPLCSFL